MSMKRLVALRPLRYQRRDLVAGDAFDAPTVDASYLMRTGRAEPFSEEEHAPLPPAAVTQPATLKRGPGRPRKSPPAAAPAEEPAANAGKESPPAAGVLAEDEG